MVVMENDIYTEVLDMNDAALALAGAVGGMTAIVHGALTQRLMVKPIATLIDGRLPAPITRIVPALLQFSTFNWLVGGLALIAAAFWMAPEGRLTTCALVGSSYLFAAVGNFWGTRGRHPGWMLMVAALILIGIGILGD